MNRNAWRTLAAALTFIVLTSSSTATSSLFVAYRTQWGLTTADIAIVFSVYVGTLIPVLLLFGGYADRYGRRRVLATGISFMILGLATLMVANGLGMLIVARLLQGIGAGLAGGAITAAFAESYRGTLTPGNAIQSVIAVGLSAGPVIAAVAYNFGGGPNLSYLPMLLLAVGVLALTPLFKKAVAPPGAPLALEEPLPPSVVWPALRFAMPLVAVGWGGSSLFLSFVPAYLATTLHAVNPLVGAGALVAVQLSSLIATLRLGNVAPERSGIASSIGMIVGLALLVAGTTSNSWALIVLATILVGAGSGVASAAAFAISGRVGRGQRARIFSRMYVVAYAGYSIPSLAIGFIAVHMSLAFGFTSIIAVLALITAALPLLRAREEQQPCSRSLAVAS